MESISTFDELVRLYNGRRLLLIDDTHMEDVGYTHGSPGLFTVTTSGIAADPVFTYDVCCGGFDYLDALAGNLEQLRDSEPLLTPQSDAELEGKVNHCPMLDSRWDYITTPPQIQRRHGLSEEQIDYLKEHGVVVEVFRIE